MKLTVPVDTNTIIDRYFSGEPEVSYLIETDENKILFDTGYSDMFIRYAEKLNQNLLDIDYLVISHGHIDHTGGLKPFCKLLQGQSCKKLAAGRKNVRETIRFMRQVNPAVLHACHCTDLQSKMKDTNTPGQALDPGRFCGLFRSKLRGILPFVLCTLSKTVPTSWPASLVRLRIKLSIVTELQEVGSGLTLEYR